MATTTKDWEPTRLSNLQKSRRKVENESMHIKKQYSKAIAQIGPLQRSQEISDMRLKHDAVVMTAMKRESGSLLNQVQEYKSKLEQECRARKEENQKLNAAQNQLSQWQEGAKKNMLLLTELEGMHQDHQLALKELHRHRGAIENKDLYILHVRKKLAGLEQDLTTQKLQTELEETNSNLKTSEKAFSDAMDQNKKLVSDLTDLTNSSASERKKLANELEQAKEEASTAERNLRDMSLRVSATEDKLALREDTLKHFREENLMLRNRNADLVNEVNTISSERNQMSNKINKQEETLRLDAQKTEQHGIELQCYKNQAIDAKRRVEELVAKLTTTQHRVVELQQSFIKQIQSEESRREEQRVEDKKELWNEIEKLHELKSCTRCRKEFSDYNNTNGACSYHPGKLAPRPPPFEGDAWTCCQKRDAEAIPCQLGGRHTTDPQEKVDEEKVGDSTIEAPAVSVSEPSAPPPPAPTEPAAVAAPEVNAVKETQPSVPSIKAPNSVASSPITVAAPEDLEMSSSSSSLLAELDEIFKQDPDIDEVAFQLLENKSMNFYLEEHKLAVSFNIARQLYEAGKELLFKSKSDPQGVLSASRAVLLVSADCYTAWNVRKQAVVQNILPILYEIKFSSLILTKQPKSIDTWAYKKWLMIQYMKNGIDSTAVWTNEIQVCDRMAQVKPRNYHAWSYRLWIVQQQRENLLASELRASQQWISTHVSDHSGWYYRISLLNLAWNKDNDTSSLNNDSFQTELTHLNSLLALYPKHENLWCFRRFLWKQWLQKVAVEVTFESQIGKFSDSVVGIEINDIDNVIPDYFDNTKIASTLLNEFKVAKSFDQSSQLVLRYLLWICTQVINQIKDKNSMPFKFIKYYNDCCTELLNFGTKSNDSITDHYSMILESPIWSDLLKH